LAQATLLARRASDPPRPRAKVPLARPCQPADPAQGRQAPYPSLPAPPCLGTLLCPLGPAGLTNSQYGRQSASVRSFRVAPPASNLPLPLSTTATSSRHAPRTLARPRHRSRDIADRWGNSILARVRSPPCRSLPT